MLKNLSKYIVSKLIKNILLYTTIGYLTYYFVRYANMGIVNLFLAPIAAVFIFILLLYVVWSTFCLFILLLIKILKKIRK